MSALRFVPSRNALFAIAALCVLVTASASVYGLEKSSAIGAVGTCPRAHDPGFKSLLKAKYVQYAKALREDTDNDDIVMNGGSGEDNFFMTGRRKYVSLAGKGGDDYYFLPLKGSYQEISERPVHGESNTLVITDMINPRAEPLHVMRGGSSLQLAYDRLDTSGQITIKNWFGNGGAPPAPVSCFVFLPDLTIYGPNDIAKWLRNFEAIVARRKAGPPRTVHVPIRTLVPKPQQPASASRVFGTLPAETVIAHIGVYESEESAKPPKGIEGNRYGGVTVNVWKTDAPVLLVLTAYEPVSWYVNASAGARIAGVILSGYYRQSVQSNADGIPVRDFSRGLTKVPYFFAYRDGEMAAQAHTLGALAGLPIVNIRRQGAYKASSFDIE